jgi:serine/threonine-protein kinase
MNFGQYEIISEIGRGGMGIVYKARNGLTDEVVAIKQLVLKNIAPDKMQEFRDRFKREAETAQRLKHANIVKVYDVRMNPDNCFYVMELLDGRSLRRELEARGGRVTVEDFWPILSQVVEGLSFAHSMNVVHRDVKPDNIFILKDGTVKITDFGIARVAEFEETHLTKTGVMMGTLAYVSPEQLQDAKNVDHRADIFSLGVVTYEALCGETPFIADGVAQTIVKIVSQEEKPVHIAVPYISVEVSSAVSKALRKKARDRYRSVNDFCRDYEAAMEATLDSMREARHSAFLKDETNAEGMRIDRSMWQTQAGDFVPPLVVHKTPSEPPQAIDEARKITPLTPLTPHTPVTPIPAQTNDAFYATSSSGPVSRSMAGFGGAFAGASKDVNEKPLQIFDCHGKNDAKMIEPAAISYRAGKVVVADVGSRLVHVFSFDGRWLNDLTPGSHPSGTTSGGRIARPSGIAQDNKGRVYISDSSDPYVRVFDSRGVFWKDICNIQGKDGGVQGLALDSSDLLYLSDSGNRCIQILQCEMGVWLRKVQLEDGKGGFQLPSGIATDRLNQLYVTDYGACRISVFNKSGALVRSFGRRGSGEGEFNVPKSVAIDKNDRIYVLDSLNHRVQVFTPLGEYMRAIGCKGNEPGQFLAPCDLSIDPGNALLYIADKGNHRVQVFEIS